MKKKNLIIFFIVIFLNSSVTFSWSANLAEEAFNGNIENVKRLLNEGVDVNATIEGQTALMLSAYKSNAAIVKILLANKADANIVRPRDKATALNAAVQGKNKAVVKMLLDNGADVNAKTNSGNTALMTASRLGYLDIVNTLLSAPVSWQSRGIDINAQDNDGVTALMYAASKNHMPVVKALIAAGADINKKNKMGLSVLGIAQLKSREMTEYISSLMHKKRKR